MPTQVAYLGPKGTYAEKAAYVLARLEKLSQPTFIPCSGLKSVVQHLANKDCEAAVVPIENSVEGGVTATLDSLWAFPELFIKRALVLPIKHALLSNGAIEEISEVLSHPQALAQCGEWLNRTLPNAVQLPTSSTSEAVRMIQNSKFRAAIASKESSENSGVNCIAYPINDVAGNRTRFVLLQCEENKEAGEIASFAFSLKANKPGSLLKALQCIANLGLNMNRIESRPSKRELGEYIFFVDIQLGNNSKKIKNVLRKSLDPLCQHIIYFGSYDNTELN